MFQKIDFNQSGKIDVRELQYMFLSNGIEMTKDEIQKFFDVCKCKHKGYFSFEEFKNLYNSREADDLFRFYINRARRQSDELFGKGVNNLYLPCNLSRLLEHMTVKQRRETLLKRIQDDYLNPDRTNETIKNFIKLFIINMCAVDSISNDEWSRKINKEMVRRKHKEAKEAGINIGVKDQINDLYLKITTEDKETNPLSLKRLDSFHLNELTKRNFESPLKRSSICNSNFTPSPRKSCSPQKSIHGSPGKDQTKCKLEAISEADSFCTD